MYHLLFAFPKGFLARNIKIRDVYYLFFNLKKTLVNFNKLLLYTLYKKLVLKSQNFYETCIFVGSTNANLGWKRVSSLFSIKGRSKVFRIFPSEADFPLDQSRELSDNRGTGGQEDRGIVSFKTVK